MSGSVFIPCSVLGYLFIYIIMINLKSLFMNAKLFLLFLFTLFFIACDDNEKSENVINDIHNTWKLEGYGNKSGYKRVSIGECGHCYTLTFNEDCTFFGRTKMNSVSGKYTIDDVSLSFTDIYTTYVAESELEGHKYLQELSDISSFSLTNTLKLFYGDNGNYMLFRLK